MFTMTVVDQQSGSITLAVAGKVSKDALPEIARRIVSERKRRRVSLDLSEVTLLDQEAARFFADSIRRGVELLNCPLYIQHWISPQTAHEPEN